MLARLELFLLRCFQRCLTHARAVLFVSVLVFLGSLYLARTLKPAFSFYDMMAPTDPSLRAKALVEANFDVKKEGTLVLKRTDGRDLESADLQFFCELTRKYEKEPPQFFSILSAVSLRHPHFEPASRSGDLPRLLFATPFDSAESCGDVALYEKTVLSSPWKGLFAKNIRQDYPWQLSYVGPAELKLERAHFSEFLSEVTQRIALENERRKTQLLGQGQLEVLAGGALAFQVAYQKAFFADSRLNLLALAVVLFMCRLFFNHWRKGFVLVGSFLLMGAVIYGAWAATGATLDLLGNALFLMLMLASVEDLVFVLNTYKTEKCHWRKAFRMHLVPGFFTSLTTVIGFGSLCISSLLPIRRFGAFAAAGCALEWGLGVLCSSSFNSAISGIP